MSDTDRAVEAGLPQGPLIQRWCSGCGAQMHEGEPLHKVWEPGHREYVPPPASSRPAAPDSPDQLREALERWALFYDEVETYSDGERGCTQLDHGHEEYEARMDVLELARAALSVSPRSDTALDVAEDRITFLSFDGEVEARTGQGDHCVMVQIAGPGRNAGIVFSDDEAEAFGRSLIRRAEYSRTPDQEPG